MHRSGISFSVRKKFYFFLLELYSFISCCEFRRKKQTRHSKKKFFFPCFCPFQKCQRKFFSKEESVVSGSNWPFVLCPGHRGCQLHPDSRAQRICPWETGEINSLYNSLLTLEAQKSMKRIPTCVGGLSGISSFYEGRKKGGKEPRSLQGERTF